MPTRRALVRMLCGGVLTVVAGPACSAYYRPERGPGYEPWRFPDESLEPRLQLVHAALLASNPHNSQPWWFEVREDRIDLHAANERNIGTIDPFLREMHVGLGCALENLTIAAAQAGRSTRVSLLPDPDDPTLVAAVELGDDPVSPREDLFDAIAHRHTNRGPYGDFALDPGIEDELDGLVDDEDVQLVRLTGPPLDTWRRVTVEATEAFLADAQMSTDSHRWFRHSLDEITEHRDGITTDAAGLGSGTRFFGKTGPALDADASGRYWLNATERTHVATGSGFFALCSRDRLDHRQQLVAGRTWQRLHLWCAANGVDVHPVSQMIEMADRERFLEQPSRFTDALASLAPDSWDPAMLFRIGHGLEQAYASPRRPVAWVTEGPE